MIVELSSITSYSIMDGKFGIGTQRLHVNPTISENQRIFTFPLNAADIVYNAAATELEDFLEEKYSCSVI